MAQTDIDVPRTPAFWKKLWALTWPYFRHGEPLIGCSLLAIVVALNLGQVGFDVILNYWNNDFYNALQNKDEAAFWHQMLKFVYILVPYIIVYVYATYLQQMLQIRWRKWMTDRFLRKWLENQSYYRLQLRPGSSDNPEQRIEQDVSLFTANTLDLALGLMSSVVTLVSFVTILWTLSGAISFTLSGHAFTIPGYMVWIAVLYAAVGSYLTFLIGRVLIKTNFQLQRSNATFRFSMSRLRENSESVAFYQGEPAEHHDLMLRFGSIWHYWWLLMRQQKRLNFFIIFYRLLANVFPILVASPRYFSGAIQLGALMQISSAFGSVQGALSWFVSAFTTLAEWKATVDRLIGFSDALAEVGQQKSGIEVSSASALEIVAEGVDLGLPDGRQLINDLNAKIEQGDKILVTGPSGSGKTTLFRALAGLWPFGKGSVRKPVQGHALFLPQRPYLPHGTLRDVIRYPGRTNEIDDTAMQEALDAVNLSHLKNRLGEEANWSLSLSIGEQQRLAIARALLQKPEWLYLDEATAALDAANEQRMYQLLKERLPDTTILSIAHRPEVAKYHHRRLSIDAESRSATIAPIGAE